MVDIVQTDVGDMELAGTDARGKGFIYGTASWHPSAPTTIIMLVADRAMRVKGITARINVAGTDGSAVTGEVRKVASGTALGSGTVLHASTINLKGTANTNQALTLSTTAGVLDIAAGDTIALSISGTLTSAIGGVTIALTPR